MLREIASRCERLDVPCQVCMEAYMACGVGICMGCVVPTVAAGEYGRYQRVCLQGPVFDARTLDWSRDG